MTADRTRSASKSPAKKSAKQSPAKKSAKTSSAKRSASTSTARRGASAPRAESRPRPSAALVAQKAGQQLAELTGRTVEGVTGIERSEDGWQVNVEVLELRRIPETTDVLAQYQVDVDESGELTGYRRGDRYTRGSTRED